MGLASNEFVKLLCGADASLDRNADALRRAVCERTREFLLSGNKNAVVL